MFSYNRFSDSILRIAYSLFVFSLFLPILLNHRTCAQATYSVLHKFQDGTIKNDGAYPASSLVQGVDGNFYGTTQVGGTTVSGDEPGDGTAFKMTPSGQITILHSFGDGSVPNDGIYPSSSLTLGSDGNFYGTTLESADGNAGDIFRMTPGGVVTILYEFFDVGTDGNNPGSPVVFGSDGCLYGTTEAGGTANEGIVFKLTLSGVETILHNFGDGSILNDGATPGPVIQSAGGAFYGVTSFGGSANEGTIYQISSGGQFAILHNFGDGSVANDGQEPNSVIQASDGNLYGTTMYGGLTSTDGGTIFKSTSTGGVSILHSFGQASDGNTGQPAAGLIQGTDGNLYGTAPNLLFEITTAGAFLSEHTFANASVGDGYFPMAPPVEAGNGILYGTTVEGGSTGAFEQGAGITYGITVAGLCVPAAPSGLVAVAFPGDVSLTWNASSAATSYNIYRGTSPGGEGATPLASGLTTTSSSDTTVTNGTTYYYTVKAVNADGVGSASNEVTVTPLVAAPAAPTSLAAVAGNAQVSLTWAPVSGAASYSVYRGTTAGGEGAAAIAGGITAASTTDTCVTNGTTYYYTVTAVNAGGVSGASNEASASPQVPAPAAPTSLAAVAGNAQVSLTWAPVSGAASYNIYRGTSAGSEAAAAIASGVSTTSTIDTTLTNGTTYYYVVRSVAAGVISAASNEVSSSPALPALSIPTCIAASPGHAMNVVTWSLVAGAASYNVYRGTAPGAESATPVYTSIWGGGVYDTTVTNGTTYYYTVRAVSAGGMSGSSAEVSATPQPVPPNAPTGFVATAGAGQIDLAWIAPAGAISSYTVYRGTASGQEKALYSGVITMSFVDTAVTANTTYYYKILPVNSAGSGYATGEVSAIPLVAAPATPASLAAVAGNAQVSLTWAPVAGAASYNVYRGTIAGGEGVTAFASGITAISLIDTAVTNGTTYYYTVKAVNARGVSGASNEVSSSVPASSNQVSLLVPALSIPTGMAASAGHAMNVVTWSLVAGAASYNVYRGTAAGAESATPVYTSIWGGGVYDTTVTNGTTYYYTVRAVSAGGMSGSSVEVSATPQPVPPNAPTGFVATAGAGQIDLAWIAPAGAISSYTVYRGTASGQEKALYSGVTTTSFVDTAVTANTTYYYKILPVNSAGPGYATGEVPATTPK